MHRRALRKPDGRALTLYGRAPILTDLAAPAAGEIVAPAAGEIVVPAAGEAAAPTSHLRWHPLRGEWVVYAGHRQHRTFLPPPEWNPLAPSRDPAHPSEVPPGTWDVAVFDNLFSALGSSVAPPRAIVDTAPGLGTTEVVVFTQDPRGSLGGLGLDHLELIIEVWADRTQALARRGDVAYVLPFENRGVEVGVTLHHPHGQIYAYPFVPPVVARQLELQRSHHEAGNDGLLAELIAAERADGRRILYLGEHALAWVPVCARWAYEIWVAPLERAASLAELAPAQRRDFARALQISLRKLDKLWDRPMPYVLAVYQAPVTGEHPYVHLHVEILPWLRMPGRVKYLAGSEVAAGTFTADTFPEAKAKELQDVEIEHD